MLTTSNTKNEEMKNDVNVNNKQQKAKLQQSIVVSNRPKNPFANKEVIEDDYTISGFDFFEQLKSNCNQFWELKEEVQLPDYYGKQHLFEDNLKMQQYYYWAGKTLKQLDVDKFDNSIEDNVVTAEYYVVARNFTIHAIKQQALWKNEELISMLEANIYDRFDTKPYSFTKDSVLGAHLEPKTGYFRNTLRPNSLFKSTRRAMSGLYAIVMPVGCGKTTLSRKFGFVDCDAPMHANGPEIKKMAQLRQKIVEIQGDRNYSQMPKHEIEVVEKMWSEHNNIFNSALIHGLAPLVHSSETRTVICCHSIQSALAIGARVIMVCLNKEELFQTSDRKDDADFPLQQNLRRMNVSLIIAESARYKIPIVKITDYNQLDLLGLYGQMVIYGAPTAMFIRNDHWPNFCNRFLLCNMSPKADKLKDLRNIWHCTSDKQLVDMALSPKIPMEIKAAICHFTGLKYMIDPVWPGPQHNHDWVVAICNAQASRMYYRKEDIAIMTKIIKLEKEQMQNVFLLDKHYRKMLPVKLITFLKKMYEKGLELTHEEKMILLCSTEGSEQHALAKLIWFRNLKTCDDKELQQMVYDSLILYTACKPAELWIKKHKEISNLIRRTHRFLGRYLSTKDYTIMLYTECLVGWVEGKPSTWEEITKRMGTPIAPQAYDPESKKFTKERFYKLFTQYIEEEMNKIDPEPKWSNGQEYWAEMANSLASGTASAFGSFNAAAVFKDILIKAADGEPVRSEVWASFTKRTIAEVISADKGQEFMDLILQQIGTSPTTVARKNEVGKVGRMLATSSMAIYFVMNAVLAMFENNKGIEGSQLNTKPYDDILVYERLMQQASLCQDGTAASLMTDFKDFNAMHSIRSMSIIFASMKRRYIQKNGSNQFVERCFNWIHEALNAICILDEKGNIYGPLKSGLLTGWRCTTWINSLCCKIYLKIATRSAADLWDNKDMLRFKIESGGDDSVIFFQQLQLIFYFLEVMSIQGTEIEPMKQLVSERGLNLEFFRKFVTPSGWSGCLCRSLGNFLSGNWDGRDNNDIFEKMSSAVTNCRLLMQRGLDRSLVEIIYSCVVDKWCRVGTGSELGVIPPWVLHARKEDNGMGIPNLDGELYVLESKLKSLNDVKEKMPLVGIDFARNSIIEMSKHATYLENMGIQVEKNQVIRAARRQATSIWESATWKAFNKEEHQMLESLRAEYFFQKGTIKSVEPQTSEEKSNLDETQIGNIVHNFSVFLTNQAAAHEVHKIVSRASQADGIIKLFGFDDNARHMIEKKSGWRKDFIKDYSNFQIIGEALVKCDLSKLSIVKHYVIASYPTATAEAWQSLCQTIALRWNNNTK